jgi:hypothetical protein
MAQTVGSSKHDFAKADSISADSSCKRFGIHIIRNIEEQVVFLSISPLFTEH